MGPLLALIILYVYFGNPAIPTVKTMSNRDPEDGAPGSRIPKHDPSVVSMYAVMSEIFQVRDHLHQHLKLLPILQFADMSKEFENSRKLLYASRGPMLVSLMPIPQNGHQVLSEFVFGISRPSAISVIDFCVHLVWILYCKLSAKTTKTAHRRYENSLKI